MKKLVRFEKYSREDIHDIFSPNTKFVPNTGTWGLQGIIRVPETKSDYIFIVTYKSKQSLKELDENIDENGILTWRSQKRQKLNSPMIKDFINHDYLKNNFYLFLRTSEKEDYEYMGLLAYVEHDNQRERPVYFKWQILDWNNKNKENLKNDEKLLDFEKDNNTDKMELQLSEDDTEYIYEINERKGKDTKEFYSNKNYNFEGEAKKNSAVGKKGEDLVVEYEKMKLIAEGRNDLAEKVFATRNIAGNAERFDVLSYDKDGNEKYIEVKTTKGNLDNLFYISENEIAFSEEYPENYYLYRIYKFDTETMSAFLSIKKGPIERKYLQSVNYVGRIGEKRSEI